MSNKTTLPKRKFTDEFKLGDYVYVIREENGWHEGAVSGIIMSIEDYSCQVSDIDNKDIIYTIKNCRDIYK